VAVGISDRLDESGRGGKDAASPRPPSCHREAGSQQSPPRKGTVRCIPEWRFPHAPPHSRLRHEVQPLTQPRTRHVHERGTKKHCRKPPKRVVMAADVHTVDVIPEGTTPRTGGTSISHAYPPASWLSSVVATFSRPSLAPVYSSRRSACCPASAGPATAQRSLPSRGVSASAYSSPPGSVPVLRRARSSDSPQIPMCWLELVYPFALGDAARPGSQSYRLQQRRPYVPLLAIVGGCRAADR